MPDDTTPQDPIARFQALFAEAAAVDRMRLPEPTAFALGTVDASGRPAVRMLLLKGVDERGFVFYTHFDGRKGRELAGNPNAALCFHWQPLEIQVRVEGPVARVSDEEADAYFATRPRGSQLGAWASRQSRPIAHDGAFAERLAEVETRFADQPVTRPAGWGGFRLTPDRIEFWKNQPNRWHDRELYEREGTEWRVTRLYP